MARIYVETSFVSACVTDRTDAASVYRQQVSQDWWRSQSSKHELAVSAEVVAELSEPSYRGRIAALEWIGGLPLLAVTAEVRGLAKVLVREKVMPGPLAGDAVHVACACWHGIDYIVTWNVRHLANPNKLTHLRTIALRLGLVAPQIVTPDLLWEEDDL